MDNLNVLYICDENFAEVAGVSITSLFKNNPSRKIHITVYLLTVEISSESKNKFLRLSEKSGHDLILIDATEEFQIIQQLNLSLYRGSAMTNLRLYFDKLIPQTVHRILYIDCDTIITDELIPLCNYQLNGKLLAMTLDAYGKILRKSADEVYYNAGVLLIDCDRWRNEYWRQKIEVFIKNNTEQLAHPDQDVFNHVCKGEIDRLPIRYNLQVVHREYVEKLYFRYLAPENYYSGQEIEDARNKPAIIHMIRSLGTNPWYKDGKLHPDYKLYQSYKNISQWEKTAPQVIGVGKVIRCERILKKVLPQRAFFAISLIAMKIII